jgi:hypothetical protein
MGGGERVFRLLYHGDDIYPHPSLLHPLYTLVFLLVYFQSDWIDMTLKVGIEPQKI